MTAHTAESNAALRWWTFLTLAAIVAAASLLAAWWGDFSVEAIRRVIRLTAQMSLFLFLAAFSASALYRLWPNAFTRFLITARRPFGLAFAFSHAVHALALFAFSRVDPQGFDQATDPAMFVFGGLAYLFIALMAATSSDSAIALLGPRNWRRLHTVGSHVIWLTFLVAEGKRAVHDIYYWPFVAALLVVMVLRVAARFKRGMLAPHPRASLSR